MRRSGPWTLTAKFGAIGGVLLVLALSSIALTLSVTWQLEGGAAAVNEAGRMRMQTWRMAQALQRDDTEHLAQYFSQFEAGLALLQAGDPSRPLFVPHDAATLSAFDDVQSGWQALRRGWTARPHPDALAASQQAEAFVGRIDRFVSAIEGRLARWTALLHAFQLALMGLALVAAVTLLYAAYLFVLNPLSRLQQGLARVEGGDLAARVEIGTLDEFGRLSLAFNRMAGTLQGLYQNLEAKVQEKTLKVEAQHARLIALYEAASLAARADSLEELARGFARQMRQVAGADAAAIRWADETNERYVLLATDCMPQALVEDEQCLLTGECHCGQLQQGAATRVIPIVPAGPGTGARCAAHGFQQVVSVPLRLQERLLGEADLFYRGTVTLGDDERSLLDTLATHLAGAMQSLRAQALEREAAVAEERGLLARELHDSIAQSLAFLKIQVQLLRDAQRRGDAGTASRVVDEIDAGVRESTGDVRELLLHFRTRTNAEDIAPALQTTLRKFEHQTGLRAHLAIQGHGLPLAPDVQVQVLHVVQEALSNVRKHAQAQQVWVEVEQRPRWRFRVRDDGRGFAEAPGDEQPHVGLRIMRERAERIGARVDVRSSPGGGTCVELTLPEPEAA